MPDFHYTASDKNGEIVRGNLSADGKHALIVLLQERGLFFISGAEADVQPAIEEPAIAPAVPQETLSSETPHGKDAPVPLRLQHKLFLMGLLFFGVLIGVWRSHKGHRPAADTILLNQKLFLLRNVKDPRRSTIEQIFDQPYPSGAKPIISRYFVPPHMVVELTYDQDGGAGSPTNHWVRSAGIRVFRDSDVKPLS